jgi:hypothetical protein
VGSGRKEAERAGLPRPGAGLQDEMVTGPEDVGSVRLFVGRRVQQELREREEKNRKGERAMSAVCGVSCRPGKVQRPGWAHTAAGMQW